jgi:sugar/nucleoside kinase (ribokinase family)
MTASGRTGEARPRPPAPGRRRRILAFGTLALDSVDTPEGSGRDLPGGSALYFSLGASLLAPVVLVGVVGDDFPPSCLDWLDERGVDVTGIRRERGPTMRWRARYAPDFGTRQTLATDRGVAATVQPVVPSTGARAPVAFLGSTDPRLQSRVLAQLEDPELLAVDTMAHWIEERSAELRGLIARAQLLFVNETEARTLGRADDLAASVGSIRGAGPPWVVVKLGRAGARAFGPGCVLSVAPARVGGVQDPTGAGDAFAGGVMGHLAGAASVDPDSMGAALRFGAAAASLAIERFGVLGFQDADTAELTARARRLTPLPARGEST